MSILPVSWSIEAYTNVPTSHLVSYLLTASISSSGRFYKSPKVGVHRTCHEHNRTPSCHHRRSCSKSTYPKPRNSAICTKSYVNIKKFALQLVFLKTFRRSARPQSIKKCAEYIATIQQKANLKVHFLCKIFELNQDVLHEESMLQARRRVCAKQNRHNADDVAKA
jgi:hypothetical protein